MAPKIELEKVVLYNGSLAELNSRDKDKQYDFAKDLSAVFILEMTSTMFLSQATEKIKEQILKEGYQGLVNQRSFIFYEPGAYSNIHHKNIYVEGTPIVRVEKK